MTRLDFGLTSGVEVSNHADRDPWVVAGLLVGRAIEEYKISSLEHEAGSTLSPPSCRTSDADHNILLARSSQGPRNCAKTSLLFRADYLVSLPQEVRS